MAMMYTIKRQKCTSVSGFKSDPTGFIIVTRNYGQLFPTMFPRYKIVKLRYLLPQ